MTTHETMRDPVEALAAEFLDRLRRGEKPTLEEYTGRWPELAEQIRDLFPTIAAVEGWKAEKSSAGPSRIPPSLPLPAYLGDFRIIREIGRGGMGIVYEAEQESLGRRVAVKVLPRGPLIGDKQLQRFDREAKTAARLHHTNIVQVFGVGQHDGTHYYVMQYIRGVGLDRVLEALRYDRYNRPEQASQAKPAVTNGGDDSDVAGFSAAAAAWALLADRFSSDREPAPASGEVAHQPDLGSKTEPARSHPPEGHSASPATTLPDQPAQKFSASLSRREVYYRSIARIGVQVADALHYAHSQGILHRDIKPANLLLDANGILWVTDFGLAKALETAAITESGDLVGTLLYMAPEQFEGAYDARSDIYSLGVTLRELLTLTPLFQAADRNQLLRQIMHGQPVRPRKLNPHIPRDLETIVLKATARDRHERYVTAADLQEDLQNFLADRPIRARRVTPAERLWRWCRRNRALAAVGAIALALLVLVAVTTSVGFIATRQALQGEKQQRRRAEMTAELADEAFDKIFKQLAPTSLVAAAELTFEGHGGEDIEIPVQAPVSKDSARLLEELLVYYDRLAEQGENDAKLRGKRAHANRRVGDIQARLLDLEAARKAYEQAAAIYSELHSAAPTDTQWSAELARVNNALGQVLARQMRFREAQRAHRQAIHNLEAALGGGVEMELLNYELAQSWYLLAKNGIRMGPRGLRPDGRGKKPGDRSKQPKPPPPNSKDAQPPEPPSGPPPWREKGRKEKSEGPQYLNKAVVILESLLERHPSVPAYRHLLALCYRELSGPRFLDNRAGASPKRAEAVRLLRRLVEDYSEVPDYRYDLIETLALADAPPWILARKDEDQSRFEEALQISRELISQHPNIPDYWMSRNRIHFTLGKIQSKNGELNKAEQNLRQALEAQKIIVRMDPKAVYHHLFTAELKNALAEVYVKNDKYNEALQVLEPSMARLEELLQQHPELGFLHFSLATGYDRLAEISSRLHQPEKAAHASKRAREHRSLFPPPPK